MARFTYYVFPDDAPDSVLSQYCQPIWDEDAVDAYMTKCFKLKLSSEEIHKNYPKPIGFDRHINCSISQCKKYIRKFGGHGYTEHCERDGTVFEVSEVKLNENNSKFRYNHHL